MLVLPDTSWSGLHDPGLRIHAGMLADWSSASLEHVVMASVSPCAKGPYHTLQILFAIDSLYPGAYSLSSPFSVMIP